MGLSLRHESDAKYAGGFDRRHQSESEALPMIYDIPLEIERDERRIVFAFPVGPISFVTLLVTDSAGEELWKVRPAGMSGEASNEDWKG